MGEAHEQVRRPVERSACAEHDGILLLGGGRQDHEADRKPNHAAKSHRLSSRLELFQLPPPQSSISGAA